jgi:hypothetical protein
MLVRRDSQGAERSTRSTPSAATPEHALLALQRSVGNRAVAELMRQPVVTDRDLLDALPRRGVPILTEEAEREATRLIRQRRRQRAIDVIVDSLIETGHLDRELLLGGRIRFDPTETSDASSTPRGFRTDDTGRRVAKGTRVVVGRSAFDRGLPMLVSTILHELRHVEQFQVGSISRVPGQRASRALLLQQDVEAFGWELLHLDETGMGANPRAVREAWNELHDNWSRLGVPGRRPLADLYERAHAAAEAAIGAPLRNYRPLPARR